MLLLLLDNWSTWGLSSLILCGEKIIIISEISTSASVAQNKTTEEHKWAESESFIYRPDVPLLFQQHGLQLTARGTQNTLVVDRKTFNCHLPKPPQKWWFWIRQHRTLSLIQKWRPNNVISSSSMLKQALIMNKRHFVNSISLNITQKKLKDL